MIYFLTRRRPLAAYGLLLRFFAANPHQTSSADTKFLINRPDFSPPM